MGSGDHPLRLEWLDPDSLTENPSNWRRHPQAQTDALSDVMGEVGWAGALLYNEKTGRLVDGHARRKMWAGKGVPVPVLIGSWTEEQERTILATLDPIAAMAEADMGVFARLRESVVANQPKLSKALADIVAAFDPSLLTKPITKGAGGDEFDATPEETGPTRCQPGDLWVIGGKHRLLVGDCTVRENVERLMGGEVPFLMVTDPPYGVEYDPNWRNDAAEAGHLSYADRRVGQVANDATVDWTEAYKLFGGAVAYVWHADRHARTLVENLEAAGLTIRSQIIWAKPGFVISRGHYHRQHEPCWYAYRDGESARWSGDRSQTTLWEINNKVNDEDKNNHGTQKPIECMARPIRNHGAEGDLVYDPFLGSGTTIIAGHRLGRRVYGCEIEPRYGDVILKRAEAEGLTCEKAGKVSNGKKSKR